VLQVQALRRGKQQGSYDLWQHRTELEYGVTNNFQVALYLNNYAVNANASDGAGNSSGPYVPENIDQSRPYRSGLRYDSTSLEFIYRLWSPYTDPLGVALYYEPAHGPLPIDRRQVGRCMSADSFGSRSGLAVFAFFVFTFTFTLPR